MSITRTAVVAGALLVATWSVGQSSVGAQVHGNDNNIALVDDCKPGTWPPPIGCNQHPHRGDVTPAEFGQLLTSPLIPGPFVGHPSWRNEPGHLSTVLGRFLRVTNQGGRPHTFTEVEHFGGGALLFLNGTAIPAPECLAPGVVVVPPGNSARVEGLEPGLHKFQCCFHPWMRSTVRVE